MNWRISDGILAKLFGTVWSAVKVTRARLGAPASVFRPGWRTHNNARQPQADRIAAWRAANPAAVYRALEIAGERLHLDRMPERQHPRIQLLHGSLVKRDERLRGFDAAAVVEVIEHLDEPRLAAFERVLFEFAKPATVVVTTPNVEYNLRLETLPAGKFRHKDHSFEWPRPQFQAWAERVAERFGYAVRFLPVGPEDAEVGPATRMGMFTLDSTQPHV